MAKKKSKKAAPRKKLTSERPLKNRPHEPEPPETPPSENETSERAGDSEEELLPGAEGSQKKPKRTPRQKRLPGTEDPEIEELEAAAEEYADVRDRRMELTKQEVSTQAELLKLMKKYDKKSYVHDGYDLKLVAEKEKVRVRIKKDKD